MSDSLLVELKQSINKILSNKNRKEEFNSLDDLYQVYEMCKSHGYTGNYKDFENSLAELFTISEIPEEDIEDISGGSIGQQNLTKLIATAMSSITLLGTATSGIKAFVDKTSNSNITSHSEDFSKNSNRKFNYFKNNLVGKITSIPEPMSEKAMQTNNYIAYCISNYLTEKEKQHLESSLPDNELAEKDYTKWLIKMCEGFKVNYENLKYLISYIKDNGDDKEVLDIVKEKFCMRDNIYNIQKRFIFSAILNELSRSNSPIYNTYFQLDEEVNKQIIKNAIIDSKGNQGIKSMLHVMLMAHLGKFEINRKDGIPNAEESVASIFKYGESILVRHPLAIGSSSAQKLLQTLYPGREKSEKNSLWNKRVSSHGAKITEEKVLEEKYSGYHAITNAPYAFFKGNNQGIGVNISKRDAELDSAGHILVYTTENDEEQASLVKLEAAGPGKTSVFGHGHGASTKSNKISATCQMKALSTHTPRNAVHIDMKGANLEKLNDLLINFDSWVDNNNNYIAMNQMLEKLLGPKMSLSEVEDFCSQYAKSDSDNSWDKQDYKICAKGNEINSKELIDLSAPKEMKDLGLRIFSDATFNSTVYLYYVEDEAKLVEKVGQAAADRIKSTQLRWMSLQSSYTSQESIERIYPQLAEEIKHGRILTLDKKQFYDKLEKDDLIKKIPKASFNVKYGIPGVKLYRSQKSSWGINYTVYKYEIINTDEFINYAKQNMHMSLRDINEVLKYANKWMWTSVSKTELDTEDLPNSFKGSLNFLKDEHTKRSLKGKYASDDLVTEIPSQDIKNEKIPAKPKR